MAWRDQLSMIACDGSAPGFRFYETEGTSWRRGPQRRAWRSSAMVTACPIVLLPGLTFERRTWRPIVERLGDDVCSVAVDPPAHGDSAGPPCDLADVAARVHCLVERLGIEDPV